MTPRSATLKLGVLIGGGGRTLLNFADLIDDGGLNAEVATVIASRENLAGVIRARERGFKVTVINRQTAGSSEAADDAIMGALTDAGVDLVCLAGYMRHLRYDRRFEHRIMNIHPALLPSFGGMGMYGMRVHQAVIDHGCKVSGCTVHFVDDQYDNGPIIIQKPCPVHEDDDAESLAKRVFGLECEAYPEAITLFGEGRLRVEGRRVRILAARGSTGESATGNPGKRHP